MTNRLIIPVLLLAIAGQMAFIHLRGVYTYPDDETDTHRAIVAGMDEPPFRYRVLVPALAEVVRVGFPVGDSESILLAHDALSVVFIVGFVFALYGFLRRFYAPALALLGVALVGMAANVATIRPFLIGWSWLEAWLLTAGIDWVWCNVWSADARQEGAKMEVIERIT